MSTQSYSAQALTRYLLGSLPEEETERLDELSITDDEFAEALRAAEDDLVDAYAQGELGGAALHQFESHYLASPARRERVRFAQALMASARSLKAWDPARAGSPRIPAAPAWLQWGLAAAALLMLVAGGWAAVENVSLRRQLSQTQAARHELEQREQERQRALDARRGFAPSDATPERPPVREDGPLVIAAFVLTPPTRSTGQPPILELASTSEEVAVQLELEPVVYPEYRVALVDPSNDRTVWRSGAVKASAAGAGRVVSVRIRTGLLAPGAHLLRVSGVPASGVPEIAGDYPFTVVRK